MTAHDRALELAAAAIDFPPSPEERRELEEHVARCAGCRRTIAELRADATAVRTPVTPLPVERSHVLLAGALRRRRSGPPVRMLAIAALIALGTGAVLSAGAQFLQNDRTETPPVVVRPSDAPSAEPSASPLPSVSAEGSSAPSAPAPSQPTAEPTAEPTTSTTDQPPSEALVRADARRVGVGTEIAPAPDGGAWVTIPVGGETRLYRLDPSGAVANGWPMTLRFAPCTRPLIAPDGSVRVVCHGPAEGDFGVPASQRAFAFDTAGQLLPGWPVDVPCCVKGFYLTGLDVRMDDTTLVLLASRMTTDAIVPGEPTGVSQIVTVTSDGTVTVGQEILKWPDHVDTALGPQQTGYSIRADGERSEITAFDTDGLRSGWPIELEPVVSPPAFLPDGRIAFTVTDYTSATATIVFVGADGGRLASSDALPLQPAGPWTGAGEQLLAPMLLAPDGTLRVVGGGSGPGATIWAIDPSGNVLPGWPWTAAPGLQYEGVCEAGETGCGLIRVSPGMGAEGQVIAAVQATDTGGALVAVNPDGTVSEGWPITLNRAGSAFWSVVTAGDGGTYALAIEPEGEGGFSGTVLRVADDSTVLWTRTLIEP